jgi:hypothetical protein
MNPKVITGTLSRLDELSLAENEDDSADLDADVDFLGGSGQSLAQDDSKTAKKTTGDSKTKQPDAKAKSTTEPKEKAKDSTAKATTDSASSSAKDASKTDASKDAAKTTAKTKEDEN